MLNSKIEKQLKSLSGFCINEENGRILLVDEIANAVLMFDENGDLLWSFQEAEDKKLRYPQDCCYGEGIFWITDRWNHRILLLDETGKLLSVIGSFGVGDEQFNEPCGIAHIKGIGIVVADSANARIKIFDYKGDFVRAFGRYGSDYQYYQSDSFKSSKVYKSWLKSHSRYNTFETSFFKSNFKTGTLEIPRGISVGDDEVLVADYSGRISKFNSQGEFIESFINSTSVQWVARYRGDILSSNEVDSVIFNVQNDDYNMNDDCSPGKMVEYNNNLIVALPFSRKLKALNL